MLKPENNQQLLWQLHFNLSMFSICYSFTTFVDGTQHTIRFWKTMTTSKHKNGLLQHAAAGVLLPRVVSDEHVLTACHNLNLSVCTILPGER